MHITDHQLVHHVVLLRLDAQQQHAATAQPEQAVALAVAWCLAV
jgi:hypothetical protein